MHASSRSRPPSSAHRPTFTVRLYADTAAGVHFPVIGVPVLLCPASVAMVGSARGEGADGCASSISDVYGLARVPLRAVGCSVAESQGVLCEAETSTSLQGVNARNCTWQSAPSLLLSVNEPHLPQSSAEWVASRWTVLLQATPPTSPHLMKKGGAELPDYTIALPMQRLRHSEPDFNHQRSSSTPRSHSLHSRDHSFDLRSHSLLLHSHLMLSLLCTLLSFVEASHRRLRRAVSGQRLSSFDAVLVRPCVSASVAAGMTDAAEVSNDPRHTSWACCTAVVLPQAARSRVLQALRSARRQTQCRSPICRRSAGLAESAECL